MLRPPSPVIVVSALAALFMCTGASLPDRRLLLPTFPPLIPASCPQFPALNAPGVLCESFDTDRNGVAGFQFTRLPIGVDPNDPLLALGDPNDDVLGYTQGTGLSPTGTGGRLCSSRRGLGRLGCDAPVAEENDWHLHSRFEGPGSSYDAPGWFAGGAPDGGKAHSGGRSMHWGRHTLNGPPGSSSDTIRFSQISAFVLDPSVNLGPASTLQFWHLISVVDDENAGAGFIPPGTTFGGGQVQISLMGANGVFEKWHRLTPSFNGYDSTTEANISVCHFDPGDDQLPPSDDTMCEHSPVWSDLGDVLGTDTTCVTDTDGNDPEHKDCGAITSCAGGPGCTEGDTIGAGVWARSAFELSPFAGRPARLRWIGSMGGGWSFGISRSFLEMSGISYEYLDGDDGWWIDDIVLTDLRQGPLEGSDDGDADGVPYDADCDDSDPGIWRQPDEVPELDLSLPGPTLTWNPPADPGATTIVYDVQRATQMPRDGSSATLKNDFWRGDCILTGGSDLSAVDPAVPIPHQIFFYLVRARNDCSYGRSTLTTNSTGVPRDGRACP